MADADRPRLRILLVAYLFPPAGGSGVVRATKLVRHLPACGIDVDVLTSFDTAPWPDPGRLREIPSGTVVRRAAGLLPWQRRERGDAAGRGPARRGGRVRRFLRAWLSIPDRAIYWAPFARRTGRRMAADREYDAVYAMGGPWTDLLVARRVAARIGRPLVLDFKEPWGSGPPLGWPNRFRRWLERRWERRTATSADLLLCGSAGIRDDLARRIPELPAERMEVVSNGFEPADYRGEPPAAEAPPTVAHTGYLSRAFDVEPALAGLRIAAGRGVRVRLRLLGESDLPLAARAAAAGVEELVDLPGPVSCEEAVRAQRSASGLLILGSRSPLPGGAMPSKVYEYLGSGRPVLAVADPASAVSRLLVDAGLPPAVSPADAGGIADRLVAIARGEEAGASREAAAPYEWPRVVRRIADAIRRVADRSGSPKSLDPARPAP